MDGDLPEGLEGSTSQIQSRLLQSRVHLRQLWHDVEDHVGEIEGHMGDQQGPESQNGVVPHEGSHEYKQKGQGYAGDNVRVGHGNVGDRQDEGAEPGPHPVDAQGSGCAHDCGKEAGQQSHFQRIPQKGQELIVPEQLCIPR